MDEKLARMQKMEHLMSLGKNPFPPNHTITHSTQDAIANFDAWAQESKSISIGGRIILKRVFGKSMFASLEDEHGILQIFLDSQNTEEYELWKKTLDLGDIIEVSGHLFLTQKEEKTLRVKSCSMLSKSLQPYPDKFHGISDIELRYRKRTIDLIVHKEIRESFQMRSKMIQTIRTKLYELDYQEVETPILQPIPGGANARPFITHHNALDRDLYMRIAPELYLKRLITGGMPRIFELGRVFRNEGISTRHNPEFTMLEVYHAYGNVETVIQLTEILIQEAFQKVLGKLEIDYQGQALSFRAPFQRMSMEDSLLQLANISLKENSDLESLQKITLSRGIEQDRIKKLSYWELVFFLFEEFVEEKLIGPVFITDYPHAVSPLAKQMPSQPHLTERFELFVCGSELANGFSEQNNPFVQASIFEQQSLAKEAGDDEAMFYDHDYIECLEYGMPPAGGLGIGIDRLAMILLNTLSIRDTLFFPAMKD